ncbi:MAG: phenylalanine--tRNA ligase subunit beta, partial [Nitrospirae bacterium]|nr:phenylalanine--tRNA ligase subunit beta [Fimbriimonadaceae bacterium]
MKFATSMLRDYVRTALDAEALGDLLTMSGFELEGIEDGSDPVLDIKVVSNRGDGLSVFGLAREVLAKDANAEPTDLYLRAAGRFAGPMEPNQAGSHAGVSIETPNCRRYAAAIFKEVPTGQAPEWVRTRLEAAGMRSLGLVVDLTNYVMLELGQPLHAFDLNTLAEQRIVVRQAREGEKLTTLDGVERNLNPSMMMICDAERPVAVAGVMGGLATEVTDQTRDILLESANFVNTSVRATRKALGLNTEASYRFERSVDPELVVAALNRFSELLRESIGRDCRVPGVVEAYPSKPEPVTVRLRMDRVRRLLNMPVEEDEARAYLGRLGFGVAQAEGSLEVTVPTWRPDIVREDDVIEEIGRVHGYENIPEYLPVGQATPGGVRGIYAFIDQIREEMVRLGFA